MTSNSSADRPVPNAPTLATQLRWTAQCVLAVEQGRSLSEVLPQVASALRPGVQALTFQTLRQLGAARALGRLLAQRAPAAPVLALLHSALAVLLGDENGQHYQPHTVVDQAVEATKQQRSTSMQAGFLNACLRRFLREREALCAQLQQQGWPAPPLLLHSLARDRHEYLLRPDLGRRLDAESVARLAPAGADGPDLVLVPGLGSSPAVWDGVKASLAKDYRVHLVHVAGFAGRAPEGDPATLVASGELVVLKGQGPVGRQRAPDSLPHRRTPRWRRGRLRRARPPPSGARVHTALYRYANRSTRPLPRRAACGGAAGTTSTCGAGMLDADAAVLWLQANPAVVAAWLEGVSSRTGGDGLAAVNAKL